MSENMSELLWINLIFSCLQHTHPQLHLFHSFIFSKIDPHFRIIADSVVFLPAKCNSNAYSRWVWCAHPGDHLLQGGSTGYWSGTGMEPGLQSIQCPINVFMEFTIIKIQCEDEYPRMRMHGHEIVPLKCRCISKLRGETYEQYNDVIFFI